MDTSVVDGLPRSLGAVQQQKHVPAIFKPVSFITLLLKLVNDEQIIFDIYGGHGQIFTEIIIQYNVYSVSSKQK